MSETKHMDFFHFISQCAILYVSVALGQRSLEKYFKLLIVLLQFSSFSWIKVLISLIESLFFPLCPFVTMIGVGNKDTELT